MPLKSREVVVLRFDWLELAGYMIPSLLLLLHAYCLTYFQSAAPFFFVFQIFFSVYDAFAPLYLKNHSKNEQSIREKDSRFLIPLYSYFICHWVEQWAIFNFVAYAFQEFSIFKNVLTIFMLWICSGFELLIGHELGHRKSCIHRFFGYCMYLRFLNTNFIITHNKGHHKWVATPKDPASARQGQTVWGFAMQSIPGSFKQGWDIERNRIETRYGPEFPSMLKFLMNQVLLMKLGEVLYLAVVYYIWGLQILGYAILSGLLIQMSLEIINYVEHYGLRRKEISPGVYERVNPSHSWNSAYTFNNILYFRLPRHSDHHETGSKPYQALQNCEESPQLPFSYKIAFILSMNSNLWFKVMDPLVKIYQVEKRKPTEQETQASRKIAKQAVLTATIQGLAVIVGSILL